MAIVILGIDLGRNASSVVGLDASGAAMLGRRMRHQCIIEFASRLPRCVVAMEACCGTPRLDRLLAGQGHTVRLMSPEFWRPYTAESMI